MIDLLAILTAGLVMLFAVTAIIGMCGKACVEPVKEFRRAPWFAAGIVVCVGSGAFVLFAAHSLSIDARSALLLVGLISVCLGAWLDQRHSTTSD